VEGPRILFEGRSALIAGDDRRIDCGCAPGTKEQVDRCPDEFGPRTSGCGCTFVKRSKTGIVELDERLTPSDAISCHMVLGSDPINSHAPC
jgi:hypothetical protein